MLTFEISVEYYVDVLKEGVYKTCSFAFSPCFFALLVYFTCSESNGEKKNLNFNQLNSAMIKNHD